MSQDFNPAFNAANLNNVNNANFNAAVNARARLLLNNALMNTDNVGAALAAEYNAAAARNNAIAAAVAAASVAGGGGQVNAGSPEWAARYAALLASNNAGNFGGQGM